MCGVVGLFLRPPDISSRLRDTRTYSVDRQGNRAYSFNRQGNRTYLIDRPDNRPISTTALSIVAFYQRPRTNTSVTNTHQSSSSTNHHYPPITFRSAAFSARRLRRKVSIHSRRICHGPKANDTRSDTHPSTIHMAHGGVIDGPTESICCRTNLSITLSTHPFRLALFGGFQL